MSFRFGVGPLPDEIAPHTTITAGPPTTTKSAKATITFSANEPGGAEPFECRIDGSRWSHCFGSWTGMVARGKHTFEVFARDAAGNEDLTPAKRVWTYAPPAPPPAKSPVGYWMLGDAGAVYPFGTVRGYGDTHSNYEIVDLEPTPSGKGYWVVDTIGHVSAFGDAVTSGDTSGQRALETRHEHLADEVREGLLVVQHLGRVWSFGDAKGYGDMATACLNGPMLDSVSTPSGHGYYMVGSDGGVFSFGDARSTVRWAGNP